MILKTYIVKNSNPHLNSIINLLNNKLTKNKSLIILNNSSPNFKLNILLILNYFSIRLMFSLFYKLVETMLNNTISN